MSTPNGTLTGPAFVSGVVVKDEVRPTQAALDAAWGHIEQLNLTIEHLSERLKPATCPVPIEDGCAGVSPVPIVSPLTESVQRIGYAVENARCRLAFLIRSLDL